MRRFLRKFKYSDKGFTLIELLVVVAILGILAAVAVPNLGRFMGKGKAESYHAELHDIQTAVVAMLADGVRGYLDQAYTVLMADMSSIRADSNKLTLDHYLTGLNGTMVRTGCAYTFQSGWKGGTAVPAVNRH